MLQEKPANRDLPPTQKAIKDSLEAMRSLNSILSSMAEDKVASIIEALKSIQFISLFWNDYPCFIIARSAFDKLFRKDLEYDWRRFFATCNSITVEKITQTDYLTRNFIRSENKQLFEKSIPNAQGIRRTLLDKNEKVDLAVIKCSLEYGVFPLDLILDLFDNLGKLKNIVNPEQEQILHNAFLSSVGPSERPELMAFLRSFKKDPDPVTQVEVAILALLLYVDTEGSHDHLWPKKSSTSPGSLMMKVKNWLFDNLLTKDGFINSLFGSNSEHKQNKGSQGKFDSYNDLEVKTQNPTSSETEPLIAQFSDSNQGNSQDLHPLLASRVNTLLLMLTSMEEDLLLQSHRFLDRHPSLIRFHETPGAYRAADSSLELLRSSFALMMGGGYPLTPKEALSRVLPFNVILFLQDVSSFSISVGLGSLNTLYEPRTEEIDISDDFKLSFTVGNGLFFLLSLAHNLLPCTAINSGEKAEEARLGRKAFDILMNALVKLCKGNCLAASHLFSGREFSLFVDLIKERPHLPLVVLAILGVDHADLFASRHDCIDVLVSLYETNQAFVNSLAHDVKKHDPMAKSDRFIIKSSAQLPDLEAQRVNLIQGFLWLRALCNILENCHDDVLKMQLALKIQRAISKTGLETLRVFFGRHHKKFDLDVSLLNRDMPPRFIFLESLEIDMLLWCYAYEHCHLLNETLLSTNSALDIDCEPLRMLFCDPNVHEFRVDGKVLVGVIDSRFDEIETGLIFSKEIVKLYTRLFSLEPLEQCRKKAFGQFIDYGDKQHLREHFRNTAEVIILLIEELNEFKGYRFKENYEEINKAFILEAILPLCYKYLTAVSRCVIEKNFAEAGVDRLISTMVDNRAIITRMIDRVEFVKNQSVGMFKQNKLELFASSPQASEKKTTERGPLLLEDLLDHKKSIAILYEGEGYSKYKHFLEIFTVDPSLRGHQGQIFRHLAKSGSKLYEAVSMKFESCKSRTEKRHSPEVLNALQFALNGKGYDQVDTAVLSSSEKTENKARAGSPLSIIAKQKLSDYESRKLYQVSEKESVFFKMLDEGSDKNLEFYYITLVDWIVAYTNSVTISYSKLDCALSMADLHTERPDIFAWIVILETLLKVKSSTIRDIFYYRYVVGESTGRESHKLRLELNTEENKQQEEEGEKKTRLKLTSHGQVFFHGLMSSTLVFQQAIKNKVFSRSFYSRFRFYFLLSATIMGLTDDNYKELKVTLGQMAMAKKVKESREAKESRHAGTSKPEEPQPRDFIYTVRKIVDEFAGGASGDDDSDSDGSDASAHSNRQGNSGDEQDRSADSSKSEDEEEENPEFSHKENTAHQLNQNEEICFLPLYFSGLLLDKGTSTPPTILNRSTRFVESEEALIYNLVTLSTLKEFFNGPCPQNQERFIHDIKSLLRSMYLVDSEICDLRFLYQSAIVDFFLSLLEGNPELKIKMFGSHQPSDFYDLAVFYIQYLWMQRHLVVDRETKVGIKDIPQMLKTPKSAQAFVDQYYLRYDDFARHPAISIAIGLVYILKAVSTRRRLYERFVREKLQDVYAHYGSEGIEIDLNTGNQPPALSQKISGNDERGKYLIFFHFINLISCKIEVNIKNHKLNVPFQRMPKSFFLTYNSKKNFRMRCDISDPSRKLLGLLEATPLFVIEMDHYLRIYQRSPFLFWVSSNDTLTRLMRFNWWISLAMAIASMIDWRYDVSGGSRHLVKPQWTATMVLFCSYIIIGVCSAVLLLWLILMSSMAVDKTRKRMRMISKSGSNRGKTQQPQSNFILGILNFFNLLRLELFFPSFFVFHLVCSLLSWWDPIFLALQLFTITYISATARYVLKAIQKPMVQLIFALVLILFMIYSYTVIVAYYFTESFKQVETQQNDFCDNLRGCLLFVLDLGLRKGGGIGEAMEIYPYSKERFYWKSFFDISFLLLINVVMLSIWFSIIISTFNELRFDLERREEDEINTCFVCGFTRKDFEKQERPFDFHLKFEHNVWDYVNFLAYLTDTLKTDFTGNEYHLQTKYDKRSTDWLPIDSTIYLGRLALKRKKSERRRPNYQEEIRQENKRLLQESHAKPQAVQR